MLHVSLLSKRCRVRAWVTMIHIQTYCCYVRYMRLIVRMRVMPWPINLALCNYLPCTVRTFSQKTYNQKVYFSLLNNPVALTEKETKISLVAGPVHVVKLWQFNSIHSKSLNNIQFIMLTATQVCQVLCELRWIFTVSGRAHEIMIQFIYDYCC